MVGQENQHVEVYKGAKDIVAIANYVGLEGLAEEWYLSGPLCHLVRSLQTEHYSAEDTLYQPLTPWWKPYPSTRSYTRAGL